MEEQRNAAHSPDLENEARHTHPSPADAPRPDAQPNTGRYWLGAGIALMGLSFCINMFLYSQGTSLVMTSMYVLTTLGLASIMKGLYNIFN
jgi:hypothetical protein